MSRHAMTWALGADLDPDGQAAAEVRNCPSVAVRRCVLVALAEQADPDGGGACPGQPQLAEVAGVDTRTVRRALQALQVAGLIVPQHLHPLYRTRVWQLACSSAVAQLRNTLGGRHAGQG